MAEHQTPTFEEAYRANYKRVFYTCRKMLGNYEDAEDVTQNIFLHVFKNLDKFRGESMFSTWLHRVAVNFTLMEMRTLKYKKRRQGASLEELITEDGDAQLQRALLTEDSALRSIPSRGTLEKALEKMPAGYRLVLEMRELQGFSNEEVATILETSIGNVKSQLHRALAWLAATLGAPAPVAEPEPDVRLDSLMDSFAQFLD